MASTAKHTPGPWGYGKLGNNADQWGIYDESGRTIGLSYHGEANAALFAAAPQLLEALVAAETWLMRITDEVLDGEGSRPDYVATCEQATAAIKAATET